MRARAGPSHSGEVRRFPFPFRPHPVCGRGGKTKLEGGPWCSRKLEAALRMGFVTSFLDKNHLALGELPVSILFPTVVYSCVHMYTWS